VRLFDLGDPEQGISHVVAPELGMVLPGATHACADSHAATVGALGALAFGCGSSELEHVLTTQTMALTRPPTLRLTLNGRLGPGVSAKDVALRTIAQLGVDGAHGAVVEIDGPGLTSTPVEGRFTLCNMSIEMGARSALCAPDDAVFEWLVGRPMAPRGESWDRAVALWRTLRSDAGAAFDAEVTIDCRDLEPQVTWGTDPSQVIGISEPVPEPIRNSDDRADGRRRALNYMALTPGRPLDGTPIQWAFIGSCTNARLSDLESAAAVLRGRRVADGVRAIVVPGSTGVRRAAEARGLDRVFLSAGFEWHESGCSMCAGSGGLSARPGDRVIATTNRNFEGRQGRDVRTHLASPAMVAAAAVSGHIVDVRPLLEGRA
jgi:3-isopropylmalate/(R)-2-methylmalate dehydratase large subunit